MRSFLSSLFLMCLLQSGLAQVIQKDENPGSLMPTKGYVNPVEDRTAHRVGDLITIVVSEASSANFSAKLKATKDDKSKVEQLLFIDRLSKIFKPWSTNDTSTVSGDGASEQTGRMTAKIAAIITHVMPNGTFVIQGQKTLIVNNETQTYKLSGVIRRDDVTATNTVSSESLAEAEIVMTGKGVIHDRQRRGLLTQILDWLF